jgi:serine/threonine-protein kinase HipA
LAAEGAPKSAELVISSHLSLAGATGKVGLYFDGKNWYLPRGTAPSTHIVKQSHVRLKHIVQNEQLALTTARNCGLQVADSFIINTGSGADEEILLAAGRYDRSFSNAGRVIDGLTAPLRLHQEDFAQALGIPASRKYERAGEDHMARMFDLLRRHSADPIRDMTRLWDQIVFNWLIGNTDAHVKNFSLLYSPDLRTLRLAPAYDLLAAAIYPTTRELSFRIGGAATLDAVTDATFEAAAREAGLGVRMAMQRYHRTVEAFIPALRAASESLQAEGFSETAVTAEQILQTGGIAAAK